MLRCVIRIVLVASLILVPVFALAATATADAAESGRSLTGPGLGHAVSGGMSIETEPVLLVQNSSVLPISGIYSGKVNRSRINGAAEATRTYRVRLNDDLSTGTIDVYELNGQFVAHLGFAGVLNGAVFIGKTVVLNAPANYIPDNIRLTIAADHRSLEWYHNDGTMQGSGTLSREKD